MRPSRKAEREKREAEWRAEEDRVRKLGDLFSALPACHQRDALQEAMSDRVIELFNAAKFQEGDAIIEFLPNDYARQLLDWYFDGDAQAPFPPETAAGQDEDTKPGQVQGEPQSA